MHQSLKIPAGYPKFALFLLVAICVFLVFAQAGVGLAGEPAQAGTPTPQPDQLPTPLPGAPVYIGEQVVGYVYDRVGSLSASERAAILNSRLQNLVSNPFAPQVEFEVVESSFGTDILANGELLMTVTDQDAEFDEHRPARVCGFCGRGDHRRN